MDKALGFVWQRLLAEVAGRLSPDHFGGVKTVLGVSGGADSVAMLRLVVDRWQGAAAFDSSDLVVAHFNHQLRGEASDGDQDFTCKLAESLGLGFVTDNAVLDLSQSSPVGGEASFRAVRYRFFQQTAEAIGARCVLVAHTADDNIETMLHHLFRGAGHAGLAGIAFHRPLGEDVMLVRPLLGLRRDELRAGLGEIGQDWREDASNLENRYQRNWLRGELLPMIRNRYPHADEAILRSIESQSQYREKIDIDAAAWIEKHVVCCDHAAIVTLTRERVDKRVDSKRVDASAVDLATLSAIVRLVWDRMQWPRQSISEPHLRRLHGAVSQAESGQFTLPGDVQCEVSPAQITLTRGRH